MGLRREITVVLVVKVLLLAGLARVVAPPAKRTKVGPPQAARHMLGAAPGAIEEGSHER